MLSVDEIMLDCAEHFIKQTYRNRTVICGANGKLPLIVPLVHQRLSKTPVSKVKISYEEPWQIIHLRSLESSYRKSPYFEFYEHHFRPLYFWQPETLHDWNLAFLKLIFQLLPVSIEICEQHDYEKQPADITDLRSRFHPRKSAGIKFPGYHQVFSGRLPFMEDLSIADLLFNLGPGALEYLENLSDPGAQVE